MKFGGYCQLRRFEQNNKVRSDTAARDIDTFEGGLASSPKLRPVNDEPRARISAEPKPRLSQREREVLALIAEGSTSKEIASKLFISLQTVETHRSNLMTKLRVRNMAGMVVYAVQMGLVKLPTDYAS
jgi:DNA-binding NarL/FixJ family response regulator